ncbi:hypothetical protein NPIL_211551 [Nephila pilipes]|uniref:Uncharacterized protein n=1 Tax=Nephila pilipes TaxID=299642 RepID=A0A8X6MK19_NEPPI|nr:hypothetical protein NPIL_211551 [Nephila pilipes]
MLVSVKTIFSHASSIKEPFESNVIASDQVKLRRESLDKICLQAYYLGNPLIHLGEKKCVQGQRVLDSGSMADD